MSSIHHEEILVPSNRQRRDFDAQKLEDLATSICARGLMHPIVLRNDGVTLVAGERRLRAITKLFEAGTSYICSGGVQLPDGHIPFTPLGSLTPLAIRECELEENTLRDDLTWQEHDAAVAELHSLRKEQAAESGKVQTVKDTASEILGVIALGSQAQKISNSLLISEHLADPDVASAKTRKDALKVIERKAKEKHREQLARTFGEVQSDHEIICGSAFDQTHSIDDSSVDVILTDPPYGIGADDFGDMADARHEYTDDIDFALKCYAHLFAEANRVCKPSGCIFSFCDIRVFPSIVELASHLLPDWQVWQTPLIWNKGNGMLPVPDRGPRRNYEAILYVYRGDRRWNAVGSSDVIDIPGLGKPEFGAQKPVELYQLLLSRVHLPGDVVLDPFAGTCPLIPAATALQCRAICIEPNETKTNYAKVTYV